MSGRLHSILTASSAGEPMQRVDCAELISGKGIVGDRYFLGTGEFSPPTQDPDHEITLFEIEQLRRFNAEEGEAAPPLREEEMRRNLVTENVDLNALVGHRFWVDEVELRGIRLCEPCAYLRDRTRKHVLSGFIHRGGLRAAIERGGTIAVGCAIKIEPRSQTDA